MCSYNMKGYSLNCLTNAEYVFFYLFDFGWVINL